MKRTTIALGVMALAASAPALAGTYTVRTKTLRQAPGGWMNCYVSTESSRLPALAARMVQSQAGADGLPKWVDVSTFAVCSADKIGDIWYGGARTGTRVSGKAACEVTAIVRGARVTLVAFDAAGYVVATTEKGQP